MRLPFLKARKPEPDFQVVADNVKHEIAVARQTMEARTLIEAEWDAWLKDNLARAAQFMDVGRTHEARIIIDNILWEFR